MRRPVLGRGDRGFLPQRVEAASRWPEFLCPDEGLVCSDYEFHFDVKDYSRRPNPWEQVPAAAQDLRLKVAAAVCWPQ